MLQCAAWQSRIAGGSDTAAKCVYSLEGPVNGAHHFIDGRRYALLCFYSAIINASSQLLHAFLSSKNTAHIRAARLKHLWCTAPVANCRKHDQTSWFARIGGYSVLHTDVNNAAQIRREVPPSNPQFHSPFTRHNGPCLYHI